MANELDSAIRENAVGTKRASGDAGSVEQHSLADQIEADKYLAQKAAGKDPAKPLQFATIVPPGTM